MEPSKKNPQKYVSSEFEGFQVEKVDFLKNFGGMGWRGTFWFGLSGRNNKRVSWQREKDWKYLGMRFGSLVFP